MSIISSAPEQNEVTAETQLPEAVREALGYARAYEQMAAFLALHPELAERATVYLAPYTNVCPPDGSDPVAFILDAAKAGREFGADVEEWADARYGGVKICFGPLHVKVYAAADKVCSKVVVGVIEDVQYALTFDLDGTPRKVAEQVEAVA